MPRKTGDLDARGHMEETRLGLLDADDAICSEIVVMIREARANVAALMRARAAINASLGHYDRAAELLGLVEVAESDRPVVTA